MKILKQVALVAVIALQYQISIAQSPSFTKDVAPIIYNKCTGCHRPGEIGPFSLTNYDEVSGRSYQIRYVVEERIMPPWKADPEYSHFLDENYLTDDEINTIIDWVDHGSPKGNLNDEPPLPQFPDGSALGEPDLVLEFAETHLHKGNNNDEYRYFVIPTGLVEDKVIKAIELRPGNTKIVHHALFFQDTTGKAASYDAQTAEYGFEGTDGFNDDAVLDYDQYPGYVPGQKPRYYPEGLGQKLNAGSDLVIQVHYAPYPVDQTDKSKVNIFFAQENETIKRYVDDYIMLPFNLTGGFFSFYLLPGDVKTFHGKWTLTEDRSLVGIFPHMHYLGRNWEVYLQHKDGSITNLISIPDWDFNWQGGYYFNKFIKAEKGSVIHAFAKYDNSTANPYNPNNPPVFVTWGEGTEDEMYYLPILSVDYKEGDEDIVFDELTDLEDQEIYVNESRVIEIFPNPIGNDLVNVKFVLSQGNVINSDILDNQGKVVKSVRTNEYYGIGTHFQHFDASTLPSGQYYFRIKNDKFNSVLPFIKP